MEINPPDPPKPLVFTGLQPKTVSAMKTAAIPTAAELKRKLITSEMQMALRINEKVVKSEWNKKKLSEEFHDFLETNQQQQNAPPESFPCMKCQSGQPEFVFKKCGHSGVCGACRVEMFQGVQGKIKCPICDMNHSDWEVNRIFFA